jgi:putative exporter of polyketide antibiotics
VKIKIEDDYLDRRKKTDLWARGLFCLNILAGILVVFMLLAFHFAQPEFETLFDRFYQLKLRTHWDMQYLYYLIYLVILGIFISLCGLLLGIFRGRRENDPKKALMITGIISLILLGVSIIVR